MTRPPAVIALARRLGADPKRICGPVHLQVRGRMRLDWPGDRWLAFEARQTLSVTNCAFGWRAHFAPADLLCLSNSLLSGGTGRFGVSLLGGLRLPFARQPRALPRSATLRYLTDLPFAPDAILHNVALRWQVIDDSHLRVGDESGAEVTFALDSEGRVGSADAMDLRGNPRRGTLQSRTADVWKCSYTGYDLIRSRWLPFETRTTRQPVGGAPLACGQGDLRDWRMAGSFLCPKSPAAPDDAATGATARSLLETRS